MTPASRQFVILNVLETEGKPMNIRQLGEKIGWDLTTIDIELRRLLQAGVVDRVQVARQGHKRPVYEWSIA